MFKIVRCKNRIFFIKYLIKKIFVNIINAKIISKKESDCWKKKSLKKKKTLNKRTNAKKVKKSLKRKQQAGEFSFLEKLAYLRNSFLNRNMRNKTSTPEDKMQTPDFQKCEKKNLGDRVEVDFQERLVLLSPGNNRENRLFPYIGQTVIVEEDDSYVYALVHDFGRNYKTKIDDEWRVAISLGTSVPKDIGLNEIYIHIPNEIGIVTSVIKDALSAYKRDMGALGEIKSTVEELKLLIQQEPTQNNKILFKYILELCLDDVTPSEESLKSFSESQHVPPSLLNFKKYWRVSEEPRILSYPKIGQLVFFYENKKLKWGTLEDYSINEDEVKVTLQLSESQAPVHEPVLKSVNLDNIYIYFPEMSEILSKSDVVINKMETLVRLIESKGIDINDRKIINGIQKYFLFELENCFLKG